MILDAYTYSPEKMLPKYQQPGEGTLDDTMDDSLTVTISLDDSDGQSRWKNFALGGEDLDPGRARGEPPETSEFGQIKPPPKGREVLAGISGTSGITEIPLTKLPQNVSTLLANK